MTDQVPPHDIEAEQTVLSACLCTKDAFHTIQGVVLPDHCYSDAHRHIMAAVYGLENEGRAVDLVSVRGWLKDHGRLEQVGGARYLVEITEARPAILNASQHAETVRDKARLRELANLCRRVQVEAYGGCGEVQRFIDETEAQVFEIARVNSARDVVVIGDATKEALQIVAAASSAERKGVTGVPSGFDRLDWLTTGMHDGELFIVAGRPGMGKTSFVLNMAANIARPTPAALDGSEDTPSEFAAVFFSLEMPKEQLALRLLASEARVDLARLRSGTIRGDDWAKLTEAASRLGRIPLWIDDTPAITLLELRSKVRRLQANLRRGDGPTKKLGLVAVDYMQLMQGRRSAGNREQEISELSRGLKQLAKEIGVPVMALSQLNRSVEMRSKTDKRPQLSDLRESGAIEQDADTILFIYRDEYYFKDESIDRGVAEIIIAKQRNGPTGTVRTRFTDAYTRFDNLADERDRYDDSPPDYCKPRPGDIDELVDDNRAGLD